MEKAIDTVNRAAGQFWRHNTIDVLNEAVWFSGGTKCRVAARLSSFRDCFKSEAADFKVIPAMGDTPFRPMLRSVSAIDLKGMSERKQISRRRAGAQ